MKVDTYPQTLTTNLNGKYFKRPVETPAVEMVLFENLLMAQTIGPKEIDSLFLRRTLLA